MTLTTERQQFEEWFKDSYHLAEEHLSLGEFGSDTAQTSWKAWQASRELLANREAQPVVVAWQHKGEPWRIILDRDIEEVRKTSGSWSPLYTAPPAPAVPPEAFPDDIPQEHNINTYSGITWAAAWNACRACRAAMLAQPVSQGYTLPDGWIACSERMPDETQPVIVVSDGGVVQRTVYQFCDGVWSDWYDEHDHLNADTFTHWMPLPAAPEGGMANLTVRSK